MKSRKTRLLALTLSTTIALSLIAGCNNTAGDTDTSGSQGMSTPDIASYPLTPDELGSGTPMWAETTTEDGWIEVTNEGGTTLGYSPDSGVTLLQSDGYAFKDLNKNGMIDAYEDWRLDLDTRSANIASLLDVNDVAGLMLFSGHQSNITEEVNEDQAAFLDMGLRAVLNASANSPTDTQAIWANNMQAYAEGSKLGIPVNFSTDPRSTGVSVWPNNLALSATFDTALALETAKQLGIEYRALGLTTLLGPQIEIASEPRWSRISGTFGEDPALSRDLTNASISGYQSTYAEDGTDLGWGADSLNAMMKHWPGDGAAQSGRESHNFWGQHTVYPGDNFDAHLIPFVDGGLTLDSLTERATAVMSSYSIAYDEDEKYGELVGSAYSEYKNQLLRDYGFEGVICTDWSVLGDGGFFQTIWGVEDLTFAERAYKAIMAGTDQFGGQNNPQPIIDAYQIGIDEIGEEAILARYQESGDRLLKNFFLTGLFDNPYVSVANALAVVGSDEAVERGLEAQKQTVVMLKNSDNTISATQSDEKPTVYIPYVYKASAPTFFGGMSDPTWTLPIDLEIAREYYNVVTDTLAETFTGPENADGEPTPTYSDIIRATSAELAEVDYSIVFIKSPDSGGFAGGYDKATETYVPISLQYSPYTADSDSVRTESLAGPMVEVEVENPYTTEIVLQPSDINYFGKSFTVSNSSDVDTVAYAANNIPADAKVIVALNASNPTVLSEIEPMADAILVGFGLNNNVFFEVTSGKFEPSGLLPLQFPANMDTVEAQFEDVPRDMECYTDADGNVYDFAFGLNWSGKIEDERTAKYDVAPLTTPVAKPAG